MRKIILQTPYEGMLDITAQVRDMVRESGVKTGVCHVFVPHTTAGVTINENADSDVARDMLAALDEMTPRLHYRHNEGNSRAHIKATLVGSSVWAPVEDGALVLGVWQGVYLCEFDGPRSRTVYLRMLKATE